MNSESADHEKQSLPKSDHVFASNISGLPQNQKQDWFILIDSAVSMMCRQRRRCKMMEWPRASSHKKLRAGEMAQWIKCWLYNCEELWNPGETRHGSSYLQSQNYGEMDSWNKEIQEVSGPADLVYTGDMVRVPVLSKREGENWHSRCPLTSKWALWHVCICTNTG